jgi:preprotein translocase subunit YajC
MTLELDLALLDSAPASPTLALTLQDPAPGDAAGTSDPAGGATPTGSPWGSLMFPMLLVFAIFYFVMIGPERKARRKREAMLAAVKKGDKVLTTGGMFATVAALQDDVVTLQIDDGVRVRFSRASIQSVVEADGEPAPGGAKGAK